jgi:hypothetical protein
MIFIGSGFLAKVLKHFASMDQFLKNDFSVAQKKSIVCLNPKSYIYLSKPEKIKSP